MCDGQYLMCKCIIGGTFKNFRFKQHSFKLSNIIWIFNITISTTFQKCFISLLFCEFDAACMWHHTLIIWINFLAFDDLSILYLDILVAALVDTSYHSLKNEKQEGFFVFMISFTSRDYSDNLIEFPISRPKCFKCQVLQSYCDNCDTNKLWEIFFITKSKSLI